MLTSQLPLAIRPQEQMTFVNYLSGHNHFALESLQRLVQRMDEPYIYLWGETGVGRSHLLQACCHQGQVLGRMVQYVPLAELIDYAPDMLEGLENFDIVCLDDIHLLAGRTSWEEGMFHLYNRLQQANRQLVISADVPPAQLTINLADLKSRLTAGLTLQLHDLDDDHKIIALQLHACQRGLDLPTEVGQFLLKRHSRSLPALLVILDQIDMASLAAQRRLTVPFVKEVLSNLGY